MRVSINSTFSYIMTNVNYGSALQCYALQKYLTKRGHQPEHLKDYRANPILILKRVKNARYPKEFCQKIKAQVAMHRFVKRYIATSKRGYFTESAMFAHCPQAECFIAGSDQIWRNANGSRYLNFAPDNAVKLSYAASFGRTSIPDDMAQTIQPWLNRLDGISVRENTAVEIVNSLVSKKAIRVLDPTLLLDMDEYPCAPVDKKDYCYCYFLNLGSRENVCFDQLKEYATIKNNRLLLTAPSNYSLFADEQPLFPSVEEWLGLYKNATCIFTNTFHGLVFCIIFKKQFLFFAQKGTSERENDRFYSLISLLHLEDRLVSPEDIGSVSKKMEKLIDYEKVYDIIHCERLRTDAFFEKYGM